MHDYDRTFSIAVMHECIVHEKYNYSCFEIDLPYTYMTFNPLSWKYHYSGLYACHGQY